MQNDDVVKILNRIRDQIDEERQLDVNVITEAYNDAITDAMMIVEHWISELSATPNQIKKKGGMYYN